MVPPGFEEIEAAYRSMNEERLELRRRAEQAVTQWRWATDCMYHPAPLHFERIQYPRGRWLKTPPQTSHDHCEYGLDAQGRICVEREHLSFVSGTGPDRHWFYETLYVRTDDQLLRYWYHYHPEDDARSFTRYQVSKGLVQSEATRSVNGGFFETFTWIDGQLRLIESWHAPVNDAGNLLPWAPLRRYTASYNTVGALDDLREEDVSASRDPAIPPRLLFKRLPPRTTLKSMLANVQALLIERIVSAVQARRWTEPAYCLALAWSPGQLESLPPDVALGSAAHRASALTRDQSEWEDYLWNPAEFGDEAWIDLRDEAMQEACRNLNQYCNMKNSWAGVRSMLNEVAKTLSERAWEATVPRSSDFFAYATDLELQDLRRNVKASCPPRILSSLEAHGLIRTRPRRSAS